jgi:hypothetical protein
MKKTAIAGVLVLILALFAISGCGNSDSGDDVIQPTTATVTLLTQGTGTINGIDITVTLPAGVTVQATADPVNPAVLVTDAGVVEASGAAGANTSALATYTTATTGAAATVVVHVANFDGFQPGEFATVSCNIAAGSFPIEEDFSLSGFVAVDGNGAALADLTAGFTADIQ